MANPVVIKNQPFAVSANHNGAETSTYDLLIDGAVVASLPVTALQGGVITFQGVIVSIVGPHTAVVRASGSGGNADSLALPFDAVAAAPTKPTNLQILV